MDGLQSKLQDASGFFRGLELVSTRGTMGEADALKTRRLADEVVASGRIDWLSITDNAGGNPMMAPITLGKPILYAGQEVLIHLSCKDLNRNSLESTAWQLASEGFHNILALSGDYPRAGYHGHARPVFDIDSVGLLSLLREMNAGLGVGRPGKDGRDRQLERTRFYIGAVTTNFKLHESEVVPQYLKLEKKIALGAQFIITQIGYDARKQHEQILYLKRRGLDHVPLIGSVYLLNARTARFFNGGNVPGVVVSDGLLETCQKQAESPDKGRAFFRELAAKQSAVLRGLGYRGSYFSGIHRFADLEEILEIEATFSPEDWKEFAREIRFSRPGEFFLLAEDPDTGLADPERLSPDYEASRRAGSGGLHLGYRFSKWVHDVAFTPGRGVAPLATRLYARAKDTAQGPRVLRVVEHLSKGAMFACKDCGDCSLPEITFLCPESQCAKNQRNGPCGGTRDGLCEAGEFECIWARAYERRRAEGTEEALVDHAPVIQDHALRGTSSWANTYLGRDHISARAKAAPAAGPDGEKRRGEPTDPAA
jgi:methylenetetrahydrofolate reductase (NADPH)